jgi:hypothetical protein
MSKGQCLFIALVCFMGALGLAGICSCNNGPSAIIYNQAGPGAAMQTPPPPDTTAQAQPDAPAKSFNWIKFAWIMGACLAGVLVILCATGNLHPFEPFKPFWPFTLFSRRIRSTDK